MRDLRDQGSGIRDQGSDLRNTQYAVSKRVHASRITHHVSRFTRHVSRRGFGTPMKLYQFGPEVGRHITHFESDFVMTPLVRIADDGPGGTTSEAAAAAPGAWVARPGVRIGAMHIGPGGVVGFHQA